MTTGVKGKAVQLPQGHTLYKECSRFSQEQGFYFAKWGHKIWGRARLFWPIEERLILEPPEVQVSD